MIYLDNSATTRPCVEAVAAMTAALTENWGNPSALYGFGFDTAKLLREARQKVATVLGAEPDRVFFTSGGTEADNWAVFGTAKRFGKKNKHIVTTAIEHHAILNCMKELETQGFEVTYLQPDEEGRITLDALKAALRKDTILVSVMMVNNEVGSVMPIAQMAKLTHKLCPNAIFHTDAVQGFLKFPFAARQLGADLISISSHKVHGPKGAGALYISPRLKSFPPLLMGGGQESGFRSGTEGTPAIFGFAAACEAVSKTFRADTEQEKALLNALVEKISALEGIRINGVHPEHHQPSAGSRHLRIRRLSLCQGSPEPCPHRHEGAGKGHGRLFPDFPLPGHHPGGAGQAGMRPPGRNSPPGTVKFCTNFPCIQETLFVKNSVSFYFHARSQEKIAKALVISILFCYNTDMIFFQGRTFVYELCR